MHDLKYLEENFIEVKSLLLRRGEVTGLETLLELFKKRRDLIIEVEDLKRKRNEESDKLKNASKTEVEEKREKLKKLSQKIKELDQELNILEKDLINLNLTIPNIPLASVPVGKNELNNLVLKVVGEIPKFDFIPKDHVELGEITGTIDFLRASKVSGSRFVFLKGSLARLNRALIQFMCDFHVEKGDIELNTPVLVRKEAMIGTGQFPKFTEDAFKAIKEEDEPYYLIPTAEVSVTNYLADEILDEEKLPLRFCAYSPCFRAEAGAAGRDTRGMIRLHQFEKVEMVRFTTKEQAKNEHELMVERASDILSALKLPHRIIQLCTGDMGFASESTIDIEVFLPGQNAYREISSCSSFGTFQGRRAKIRYKKDGEKPQFVVTLNGSGLPLGRTLVAIYENYQQKDGSVKIPEVLLPYMNGTEKILPIK